MADNQIRHLFPGNNTSQGFFSYFAYILPLPQTKRFYCLKGGPGVGKSTLLKHIGDRMALEGFDLEYMHCASDPDSLDGLVIPALGVALVDGTAPHVTDPVYPAAVDEIVNLGEYWDDEGIRENRDEIVRISGENKQQYKHAYKYLAAAKSLMDDVTETLELVTDKAGALSQARNIINNELSQIPITGKMGSIRRLFASAITPSGVVYHLDSLSNCATKVYLIQNLWGIGVHELLEKVTAEAVFRGLDVERYYSPLAPDTRIEHVFIPELKVAFISEPVGYSWNHVGDSVIDMTQYTDKLLTDAQIEAIDFSSKNYHTLIAQAVSALSRTKKLHDELEAYYIPHMNFAGVQKKEEEICEQILSLANLPD